MFSQLNVKVEKRHRMNLLSLRKDDFFSSRIHFNFRRPFQSWLVPPFNGRKNQSISAWTHVASASIGMFENDPNSNSPGWIGRVVWIMNSDPFKDFSERYRPSKYVMEFHSTLRTPTALGPFGPSPTSNSTVSPSWISPSTSEMWTKRSLPPSRSINPNPFVWLNHLTVPCATLRGFGRGILSLRLVPPIKRRFPKLKKTTKRGQGERFVNLRRQIPPDDPKTRRGMLNRLKSLNFSLLQSSTNYNPRMKMTK